MCTQACVTNGVAGWWGLINFQTTHWSQQQQLNERSHWRKKKTSLFKFTQLLLFHSLNFVLEKVKAKSPLTFNTTTFFSVPGLLGCPDFLKALDVVGLSWLSPFCIIQLNSILFLRRQIKLTVGSNWIWILQRGLGQCLWTGWLGWWLPYLRGNRGCAPAIGGTGGVYRESGCLAPITGHSVPYNHSQSLVCIAINCRFPFPGQSQDSLDRLYLLVCLGKTVSPQVNWKRWLG